MEIKYTKEFPSGIAAADSYRTPEKKGRLSFFSPSSVFYPKLVKIVIRSGRMAKNGKYGPDEWVNSSLEILSAMENAGIKFDIAGMDYISSFDGPAVFISNHMSTLETVVLPSIIQPKKEVTFVVKQELMNYPFFGPILASRNPIIVGRSNPREDLVHVMSEGTSYIKQGRSIIIFPQRTRSSSFNPESFNTLGVKLAKKADAFVVPLALATDAWGNGKLVKELGEINPKKTVHISFGKPFKVESSGSKEHLVILDFIRDKLIEWNRRDCLEGHGNNPVIENNVPKD